MCEFAECEHCGLDMPIDQLEHYDTDYKWASSVLYCLECAKELEVYEQEEE